MDYNEMNEILMTLKNWTFSIVVGGLVFLSFVLIRRLLLKQLKPETLVFDLFRNTKLFFVLAWALFVGLTFHAVPDSMRQVADRGIFLVSMIQIGIWSRTLIAFWIESYMHLKLAEDAASLTTLGLVSTLAKFGLYSMLCLLTLNNFGVNITALIAGLGVGGIAVALAVQNILGDLFASLTIVLDKPFVVGDQIFAGEYLGVVERIGIKTTRIRNQSGEQLIFPNGDLLKSRIRNFKRMDERRMVFTLHVEYNTPSEKIAEISQILREIVIKTPRARLERCVFKNHGYYALEFEVVYWAGDPDLNDSLRIHETILCEINRLFTQNGIKFAYYKQLPASPLNPEPQPFSIPTAPSTTGLG